MRGSLSKQAYAGLRVERLEAVPRAVSSNLQRARGWFWKARATVLRKFDVMQGSLLHVSYGAARGSTVMSKVRKWPALSL